MSASILKEKDRVVAYACYENNMHDFKQIKWGILPSCSTPTDSTSMTGRTEHYST